MVDVFQLVALATFTSFVIFLIAIVKQPAFFKEYWWAILSMTLVFNASSFIFFAILQSLTFGLQSFSESPFWIHYFGLTTPLVLSGILISSSILSWLQKERKEVIL